MRASFRVAHEWPLAVALVLALAPLSAQAPTPAAPPPGTDIHLLPLDDGLNGLSTATPVPVATTRGYENQPAFDDDGQVVLFTAMRDGIQTDGYAYDRRTRATRALWTTPEGEYSPTPTPDGTGYSVIRVEADGTQRLWRFPRDGGAPSLVLTDIKPVGYHAWVGEDVLGLFVLGQPATLQIARVSTGRAEIEATGIGRSLHRVPGTRAVSFVQRVSDEEHWIAEIDVDTRATIRLVRTVDGSSDRDYAWMPDGQTVLMSAGTRIHRWTRGDAGWTEVFDGAPHTLGAITRLAVSPKADAIAIVVNER
ncbi:MAG: hypothetical protein Q8L86_20420 [Vicinamibacterales bacterium]|nr:hypothetical protein [Vicinamibacterales bacterium]